ncbi:MAG: hypothetical protein HYX24_00010 [Candidatus Aenigmarchaeota archaeon]|nr:hypothetical protein [Candidatus Aenigmarchaeota archaeon]
MFGQDKTESRVVSLREGIKGLIDESIEAKLQETRREIISYIDGKLNSLQSSQTSQTGNIQQLRNETKAYTGQQLAALRASLEGRLDELSKSCQPGGLLKPDIIKLIDERLRNQQPQGIGSNAAEEIKKEIINYVDKRLSEARPGASAVGEEIQALFIREMKMLEDRLRNEIRNMESRIRSMDERVEKVSESLENAPKAGERLAMPIIIE